jgi:hypothetical protein
MVSIQFSIVTWRVLKVNPNARKIFTEEVNSVDNMSDIYYVESRHDSPLASSPPFQNYSVLCTLPQ